MKKKNIDFMLKDHSNISKYNNIVKRNFRKRTILIGFIICLSGLMFFLSNVFSIKSYYETKEQYHSVFGVVIDWKENFGFFRSIVEYEVNGQIFKISERFRSSVKKSRGTKLMVIYNPINPEEAILVHNFENHVIFMTVLSAFIFIFGLFVFIKGLKIKKEIKSNEGLSVPKPDDVYRAEVARKAAELAAQEAELARIEALIKEKEEAEAKERELDEAAGITVADRIAMSAAQAGAAPVMIQPGAKPQPAPEVVDPKAKGQKKGKEKSVKKEKPAKGAKKK